MQINQFVTFDQNNQVGKIRRLRWGTAVEWRLFLADQRYGALAKTVTAPFSESTRSNWLGVSALNVAVKFLPFFMSIMTFPSDHSRNVPGSILSCSAEPIKIHAKRLVRSKHDVQGAAGRLPFSHDRVDATSPARLRADEHILERHEAKETKGKSYEYGYANHLRARRTPGPLWRDG